MYNPSNDVATDNTFLPLAIMRLFCGSSIAWTAVDQSANDVGEACETGFPEESKICSAD